MRDNIFKKQWLTAAIAVLLATIAIALGYQSFKATEKTTQNEFNGRQLAMAKGVASGIEFYFQAIAMELKALRGMHGVKMLEEAGTRYAIRHAYEELKSLGINDVGVIDAKGILKYNVAAHEIEGRDFSWRRYFQEAKEMTDINEYTVEFIEFKGVEAGKKGILVAVPLFEDISGRFAGVAVCTLKSDILSQKFIASIKSSERGHAFLIDINMGYAALWSPDASLIGKNIIKENRGFKEFERMLNAMRDKKSGTAEYSYLKFDEHANRFVNEREEYLIGYADADVGTDWWLIGVWAPKGDASKLSRVFYFRQMLLLGFTTLIILMWASYAIINLWRRRAAEKIKEQEAQLIAIMKAFPGFLYSCSPDYRIEFINEQHTKRIGYDATGELCYRAIHGRDSVCPWCANEQVFKGETVRREMQSPKDNKWFYVVNAPIRKANGSVSKLSIALDITEQKRMEEDLFNAKKLESIAILAAGTAHEIINPISTASLEIELLKDKTSDKDILKKLKAIERHIDRVSVIAKELLQFSRQKEYERMPVDVNEVIKSSLILVEHKLASITVHESLSPLPAIIGDPIRLEQVFLNIIANSIDAMPDGGELFISSSMAGDLLEVQISDTGVGITKTDISKVFDPFFTTKDVGTGTGLGLSICYGIIRQHNGTIDIESKEGKGTTVKIKFPAGEKA